MNFEIFLKGITQRQWPRFDQRRKATKMVRKTFKTLKVRNANKNHFRRGSTGKNPREDSFHCLTRWMQLATHSQ